MSETEPTAVQWLLKAAEQGDVVAQYVIGKKYANGKGVRKDLVHAVDWFRRAAEYGYAKAETSLGVAYLHGYGVPQDQRQAAHWFQQAANKGYAKAQYNLALLYIEGQGVDKDLVEAHKWLSLAAAQGHAPAAKTARDLESDMESEELQRAASEAARFYFSPRPRPQSEIPLAEGETGLAFSHPTTQRRFMLASSNQFLNDPEWLDFLSNSQDPNRQ